MKRSLDDLIRDILNFSGSGDTKAPLNSRHETLIYSGGATHTKVPIIIQT